MKQIWIPKIGEPSVLEVREAADPEAGAGEVRIRVAASGINFADILARMGLYPDAPKLPAVVGYEVSGHVDQVGPEAEGFVEGDRVVALTRFGGYSDLITVPANQVAPISDALSFDSAATLPVNYLTAWIMLVWLGKVREGDRVLVHAVAGGVGQAALQICKHFGAEVLGTASASKHPRLREVGVAHAIDYRHQDFETEVSASPRAPASTSCSTPSAANRSRRATGAWRRWAVCSSSAPRAWSAAPSAASGGLCAR